MLSIRPSLPILLHGFELGARSLRMSFEPANPDARLSQTPRHAVRTATAVRKCGESVPHPPTP